MVDSPAFSLQIQHLPWFLPGAGRPETRSTLRTTSTSKHFIDKASHGPTTHGLCVYF